MLQLHVANIVINISADEQTLALLTKNYSGLLSSSAGKYSLNYSTSFQSNNGQFQISREGKEIGVYDNTADFVYFFEKDLTLELQKLRPELFFLHSAALKFSDKTILIIGHSGAGKSTTSWALTHHGFAYFSDELSPIDLNTMKVTGYPHAICIKQDPPAPYLLPDDTLVTNRTKHIPVENLAAGVARGTAKISHIFFVQYKAEQQDVAILPISPALASAKIYANALNQLSHEESGLPAASKIALAVDSYTLEFNNVEQACREIKQLLEVN